MLLFQNITGITGKYRDANSVSDVQLMMASCMALLSSADLFPDTLMMGQRQRSQGFVPTDIKTLAVICTVPVQESLNKWDEIQTLYREKEKETGYMTHRPASECIRRLVQRGLIAEGSGETGADALYDLLSGLYIIPISENPILRTISFIRLTVFERIPYSVTKRIFSRDKRSEDEKRVMALANRTTLSTAEIIKCVELKAFEFRTEEELVDTLYHDEYTTSENIAHSVRSLPQCRPVLTSVANLYLRRQIVFERR